jgi:ribosome-associated heat shock protein Hsp15
VEEVRIDKWLWATRVFKTRSIASEACAKGRIMLKGMTAKSSKMIRVGDVVQIRKPPITYSFEVLALTDKRMGAKLVPNFVKDVTPADQYEILELNKLSGFVDRARGMGRPTKKDRRVLDEFSSDITSDGFDFDFDFEGVD